jgi:hypothetical protein
MAARIGDRYAGSKASLCTGPPRVREQLISGFEAELGCGDSLQSHVVS